MSEQNQQAHSIFHGLEDRKKKPHSPYCAIPQPAHALKKGIPLSTIHNMFESGIQIGPVSN